MSITENQELVVNIGEKTQLFTKKEVEKALLEYSQKPKTFCANYNRDSEEQEKMTKEKWNDMSTSEQIVWETLNNPSFKNQICLDTVVELVRQDLLIRSNTGIKKYNTTLSRKDLKLKDWLNHLYEETLDSANYIKRTLIELENDKTD